MTGNPHARPLINRLRDAYLPMACGHPELLQAIDGAIRVP